MTVDQTYLVILGAGATQASHNARILAQHGINQLGQPHPHNADLRIWDGNLTTLGHQNPHSVTVAANAVLPPNMRVAAVYHWHARLTDGTWTRCTPNADGATPITVTLAHTRQENDQ
ncbi:hypothetical protein ABZ802_31690 [Streptomyces sp. NPDC047737]|uniref:hypothetical protein n=1 Tax=Streptomyces sp. NPDC047737 TaxID=3155740 RepID=UPI003406E082